MLSPWHCPKWLQRSPPASGIANFTIKASFQTSFRPQGCRSQQGETSRPFQTARHLCRCCSFRSLEHRPLGWHVSTGLALFTFSSSTILISSLLASYGLFHQILAWLTPTFSLWGSSSPPSTGSASCGARHHSREDSIVQIGGKDTVWFPYETTITAMFPNRNCSAPQQRSYQ
jgi:hypothetical protein